MKRHLKDKCKDSPSKKQYFVAETQEPPGWILRARDRDRDILTR